MNSAPFAVVAAVLGLCASAAFAAGDVGRGKALYAVCATCHGPEAQGMQEMNAPRLAGREQWYLKRQLKNFKAGIRGSNPQDIYGLQMAPMAQVLADDQAVDDVTAYISSLGE
jgi:cytochrome c oxidase subunit 2